MKFLKDNSYDIVRLYINQIGITIFSLVLYFSVSMIEDEGLSLNIKLGVSIFAMIFFFALLYTAAWDWGATDAIRIESGKIRKRWYKGALMALIANLINFILAAMCVISITLYMNGVNGAINVSRIANLLLRMTNAMYLGVIQAIFKGFSENPNLYNLLESYGYLVAPLLAVLSTHIGYTFGMKNIKIFPSAKKSTSKK